MFTSASVSVSMKEGTSLERLFILHSVITHSVLCSFFFYVCVCMSFIIPEEMHKERESQTQDNLIKSVVIIHELSN